MQRLWVNNPNFPQQGDGQDPIIAQEAASKQFNTPGLQQPALTVSQFVRMTGGEYLFQASISALERLGGS